MHPAGLLWSQNYAKKKTAGYIILEFEGRRSNGSAVRVQTNGQADRQTDRRYQVHYLPRFAVDNKLGCITFGNMTLHFPISDLIT